jgi:DUF4097 and DUF4098 domain-containing protein YvlB
MKRILVAALVASAMAVPALATEASFDKTLSVKAQATLLISTGSGKIHLTHGSESQIHIVGRVRTTGWGGSDAKVKEIAANPPIEQTGDIITVGRHMENLHNISIDYEVQAPQNVLLKAETGSGEIAIDGVGQNAKLETGSGSIHAHGLAGTLSAETGSGDIEIDLTGTGDAKAETGSGNIQIRGVHGAFHGQTGSGDIQAAGLPLHDWKLETGSGSVVLTLGSASFNLDAETGSGGIHVDQALTTEGSQEKDHVRGKVNGGGPLVKVETGSGGVTVH